MVRKPLISKNNGLNKKVKIFKGKEYEEISTLDAESTVNALEWYELNCSKLFADKSSILEYFSTFGKIYNAPLNIKREMKILLINDISLENI